MNIFFLSPLSYVAFAAPPAGKDSRALSYLMLRAQISPSFHHHFTQVAMSEGNSGNSSSERAENLRALAERASRQAEMAELQARQLELQANKLREQQREDADAIAESLDATPRASMPVRTEPWPERDGIRHRVVVSNYSAPSLFKTREKFFGAREQGRYDGSFKVQFTLPGKDREPKTVELLESCKGGSTFGAVKLKRYGLGTLQFQEQENELNPTQKDLVVTEAPSEELLYENLAGAAGLLAEVSPSLKKRMEKELDEVGGLMIGDIVRGWSLVKLLRKYSQEQTTWKARILTQIIGECKLSDGMCFHYGGRFALWINFVLADDEEDVILVVERPRSESESESRKQE